MSNQEHLISELIQRIDEVERTAREARDRLIPRIDVSTRKNEMRTAYARSVRQAAE